MAPADRVDIVVIGAGIAGASIAAELAASFRVLLLERESQPGYHTTGRSAALFTETYGSAVKRALSHASKPFLQRPPEGFTTVPLLAPRGTLLAATASQLAKLRQVADECAALVGNLAWLSGDEVRARVPAFGEEQIAAGLLEPDAMDIDVHAMHHGYLRLLVARGGRLLNRAEVLALQNLAGEWQVTTSAGEFRAERVVNAAGAWAGEIGRLAGTRPIGLVPKRRTAITFDPPPGMAIGGWPAVIDIDEQWYFKPDAGRLMASPADETPSTPCDAQPEEYDIAVLVDRLTRATTLQVPRIVSRWAGLRSFVVDKLLVVGFDPQVPGFFWLAGQGGHGIQTAPAVARLAAALFSDLPVPPDLAELGIDASTLAPGRLASV
ncbi:MAG TPA: FAD-dependent oxidoreductase [Burkholderiaceae bacterium]|nr:FAD-dependent oxidoreductase [Burkholderiaceae bacterium]